MGAFFKYLKYSRSSFVKAILACTHVFNLGVLAMMLVSQNPKSPKTRLYQSESEFLPKPFDFHVLPKFVQLKAKTAL